MIETWIAIGVVLLAVLTGFLLPALIQLVQTLRSARRTLDRLAPRLDQTLAEVQRTAQQVNELGGTLNRGSEQVLDLMREAGELAIALRRLRHSVRLATAVGNAIGPAVAAAIQSFREHGRPDDNPGGAVRDATAAAPGPDTEETPDEKQ